MHLRQIKGQKIRQTWPSFWRGMYLNSGACFSKVPKLFGRISGDIILFFSKRRRPKHETLQLSSFLFLLQRHMKRPALQNKQAVILRMAFSGPKSSGDFRETGPRPKLFKGCIVLSSVWTTGTRACFKSWRTEPTKSLFLPRTRQKKSTKPNKMKLIKHKLGSTPDWKVGSV